MTGHHIGQQIRRLRTERQLTQEKLAEILHIGHQTISKWETGQLIPDIAMLISLSTFFDVSLDALCGRSEQNAEEIVKKFPLCAIHDSGTYDQLCRQYASFRQESSPLSLNDRILSHELEFLRLMHDAVRTDAEKEAVNRRLFSCAQTILDFSRDDRLRSRANFALALYYTEQSLTPEHSALAKEHAGRVLFSDMSPAAFASIGLPHGSPEWEAAQQETIAKALGTLRCALTNLYRHDQRRGKGESAEAIQKKIDQLEEIFR